jgi:hypothetical protein
VAWGKALARLLKKYPNLTGWTIDDFTGSNLEDPFTPSYVKKMTKTAKKINPDFTFRPVVYYSTATTNNFSQKYGPYIDGIIFPYTRLYNVKPLPDHLDRIAKLFHPKSVILMVYAKKLGAAPYQTEAQYVHDALQIGLEHKMHGNLAGVTTYKLSMQPHKTGCGEFILALGVRRHTATKAGDYTEASQKVQLDPNTKSYHISFWQKDERGTGAAKGYHLKQFLVNGNVVWSKDGASDGTKKEKVSLDLTPYLQGKTSTTIAFRLYEEKGVGNYQIQFNIANVQGQGFKVVNPNFTVGKDGWTYDFTPDTFRHRCDPQRQLHMFDAVKELYGSWEGH